MVGVAPNVIFGMQTAEPEREEASEGSLLRNRLTNVVFLDNVLVYLYILFAKDRFGFLEGKPMEQIFGSVGVEIVGGLIVTALVGTTGYLYGRLTQVQKFVRRHDSAISSFSNSLGSEINSNSSSSMIVKAKKIVSIRDATRNQLSDLSKLLNSDIDKLSSLLARAEEFRSREERVPDNLTTQIEETLEVLVGIWPTKKPQIDIAIRKLLTELGLNEFK